MGGVMKYFKWILLFAAPLVMLIQSCGGGGSFFPPSLPPVILTLTFTPLVTFTFTVTPTGTVTPTVIPSPSPTNSPTQTHNPSPLTATPTNSPTNTPTTSPTFSPTGTPTNTPTLTGTWMTPTITNTLVHTATACLTQTFTSTACMAPTPPCSITGTLLYTGSGTVDSTHPLWIGYLSGSTLTAYYGTGAYGSNTYRLYSSNPGVQGISVFYNFQGLPNISYNYVYEYLSPVPGERYLSSGSCAVPAVVQTIPVTFVAGTSTGPTITIDDSCSFWGFYGTVNYTGNKGTVQYCRTLNVITYLDAGYSSPSQPSASANLNGSTYGIVTNIGSSPTGLTPLYVRAWFDVNGDHAFDTGDPYMDLGQITPTTDGLQFNISFGDALIK